MIEKLKEHEITDKTGKVLGTIGCDLQEVIDKINELVDTVNDIQKELARTKKQLEIAVNALKLFCGEDVSYYSQSKIDARDARAALEQITTLEQKD